jgi:hypothetical protein
MACHFYGMLMAFESQVDKIEAHFNNRGYSQFVLSKADLSEKLNTTTSEMQQAGIPMNQKLKLHGVDCIEMWLAGDGPHLKGMNYKIWEDVRRFGFRELAQDMIDFKMANSEIYDDTMAWIITNVAEWALCDFSNPNFNYTSDATEILPSFLLEEMGYQNIQGSDDWDTKWM